MKTLNNLIIEYKNKKEEKTLNKIFVLLQKTIHDKSTYIFYRKKFHKNNKWFRLCELGTITIDDVENELRLLILELINKTDINKPFDKYLYSSIWNWGDSLLYLCEETNKTNISDNEEYFSSNLSKNPDIEIYNLERIKMTEQEKIIVEKLKINPKIKQSQLAERLRVTQARVSQIIKKLRIKIKKYIET
ncbi:MAG: hypothetical protein WC554_19665 [Clostridia bacterium]